MKIIFKVNTGMLKTGKHLLSIFKDDDKQALSALESDNKELFNSLLSGKIKNCFGGISDLDISDKVNFNILRHRGINNISYDKKVRGCFVTYSFDVA